MEQSLFDKEKIYSDFGGDKYKLKKYLNGVMKEEVNKNISDINPDKIDECTNWMLELDEIKIDIPKEDIKLHAKSIIEQHYKPNRSRITFVKLVAACIVLLIGIEIASMLAFKIDFLGSTYNAAKQAIVSLSDIISPNVQEIPNSLITNIHRYETIEKFESSENIKVSVPTYLPCSADIEHVEYFIEDEIVEVIFTDGAALNISLNTSTINDDILNNSKKYIYNGIDYYLIEKINSLTWVSENHLNSLLCADMNTAYEDIIKNIK